FVPYSITIENPSLNPINGVSVNDTLPIGFRYQPGSVKLNGVTIADPIIATNGRKLSFAVGAIAAGAVDTLTYIAEITANARLGEATNTATATGTTGAGTAGSNVARATLTVIEDLFTSKSTLAGRVFVDDNGDGFNDKNEPGVAGIRIFMEDGRSVTSDKNGMFHFEGITPRTHIVQMDLTTIPKRYEAVPLANTRFSGRAFSQFVEPQGGSLWRTNFRVFLRPPPSTPVRVSQSIKADDNGKLWTTLIVTHGAKVGLDALQAVYVAPAGWKVLEDTASVDGAPARPESGITGLSWKLDPAATKHTIRFALQGGGKSGDKQAVAYARFASPGTPNGRTGMAANTLNDVVREERLARDVALHLNFDTRKADLTPAAVAQLDKLVEELKQLEITRIELIGHTDSRRIRADHRKKFNNNQELSEARAHSVADYLQSKLNLKAEQVTARGLGAARPVASNRTSAGRAKNRRTELKVYASKVRHILNTSIKSAS
ncbi:MAG: OmpA family protein, partial [Mariprofundaceae bacterium]